MDWLHTTYVHHHMNVENVAPNNENLFLKHTVYEYKNSLQKCYYDRHHLFHTCKKTLKKKLKTF